MSEKFKSDIQLISEAYSKTLKESIGDIGLDDPYYNPNKKYNEKSFLEKEDNGKTSLETIYSITDIDEAAALFKNLVDKSRINPSSKSNIIRNIDTILTSRNIERLWTYATNCMFKMKKMGLK